MNTDNTNDTETVYYTLIQETESGPMIVGGIFTDEEDAMDYAEEIVQPGQDVTLLKAYNRCSRREEQPEEILARIHEAGVTDQDLAKLIAHILIP